MYTRLNVVHDAEVRAAACAVADRQRYSKFMAAAEDAGGKLGLIVGGAAATKLLIGNPTDGSQPPPVEIDSYYYEFYSSNIVADARALGKIMYQLDPDGLGHYTTVITKIANYLLTIDVDGRTLIAITALSSNRGLDTAEVIMPSYRPAQFARDSNSVPLQIACTGPEIQLMSLYAALSNPAEASSWVAHMRSERTLRVIFKREIYTKISDAVAEIRGLTSARMGPAEGLIAKLMLSLCNRYATGPGRVVIGPVAVSIMTDSLLTHGARLQVIAVSSLESEARDIEAVAKQVGVEVQWTVNNPNIPTDPRLRRMTVSVITAGHREPILDVYNVGSFEIVPYVLVKEVVRGGRKPLKPSIEPSGDLKIGTPFVIMRFRLADIWTMQVLMRMKVVSASFANNMMRQMLREYEDVAVHIDSLVMAAEHGGAAVANKIFPQGSYVGRLEDAQLALKRAAKKNPKTKFYPPPYMPAAHVD
jgi:hypothetical protein